MKRGQGFTLVELLVVIAIITILASIVVPNVGKWIERGRMAKAQSEIRNAELALTKLLADAEVKTFAHLFVDKLYLATVNQAKSATEQYRVPDLANEYDEDGLIEHHTDVFYRLLRRGRNADLPFKPSVKNKLDESYMDLPRDPWDQQYQFFSGPWTKNRSLEYSIVFRSYRPGVTDEDTGEEDPYIYDEAAKAYEDERTPGNPPPDNLPGFPAPRDKTVYIWSHGGNLEHNQLYGRNWFALVDPETLPVAGLDDINNWDTQSGWSGFY